MLNLIKNLLINYDNGESLLANDYEVVTQIRDLVNVPKPTLNEFEVDIEFLEEHVDTDDELIHKGDKACWNIHAKDVATAAKLAVVYAKKANQTVKVLAVVSC